MSLPDNYDPTPQAKIWYRSATSGQLGWFVKRNGEPKIKYDRPGPREILKPFNKIDWQLCEDRRKLTPFHLGEITFEADKVLCRIYGKYEESMKRWDMLSQRQKQDWISEGPQDEPGRIKLYRIIKDTMGEISDANSRTDDPE